MQRTFIVDVGRFKAGEMRNYSHQVWEQIAKSSGKPLEKITKDTVEMSRKMVMGKGEAHAS